MKQYIVKGMSCAACQARVEKAVNAVEGVDGAAVSLLTNSMSVEGNVSPETIITAVRNAGYDAALFDDSASGKSSSFSSSIEARKEQLEDHTTPLLKKRLIASVIFLCALMYLSMGHMMWNWPLPAFLQKIMLLWGCMKCF